MGIFKLNNLFIMVAFTKLTTGTVCGVGSMVTLTGNVGNTWATTAITKVATAVLPSPTDTRLRLPPPETLRPPSLPPRLEVVAFKLSLPRTSSATPGSLLPMPLLLLSSVPPLRRPLTSPTLPGSLSVDPLLPLPEPPLPLSRALPTSSPRRMPRKFTPPSLDTTRDNPSTCTDPTPPLTPTSPSVVPPLPSPVPPPSLPVPPLLSEPLPSLSELPAHGVV